MSDTDTTVGPVAQLVEHPPCKRVVVGSTPSGPSTFLYSHQMRFVSEVPPARVWRPLLALCELNWQRSWSPVI